MKRRLLAWLGAAMTCVVLCIPGRTFADETKRVVVLSFEGKGAPVVRGHVVHALGERSEVKLVGPKEVERVRKRLGLAWGSPDTYQALGAELQISAFIEGSVDRPKQRHRAVIRVVDASTGSVSHEEPWTRKTLPQLKDIRNNFWQVMGPHILASSAPEAKSAEPEPAWEPEPEPEPTPPPRFEEPIARDEEPAEAPARATSAERPALIAWAGPRLMWRSLSYDDAFTQLSSYENSAGSPAVNAALGAQWFPGAHTRSDWVSGFGIEAEFEYALGLKSRQGDRELKTTAYEFSAGALYRLSLDSFEPRLRVGYVKHVFEAEVPLGVPMPGVSYSSVRIGLGTAIHLVEWLYLDVNVAYLHVLDAGEIASNTYDPNLSTRGLEFGGAVVTRFKEVYGLKLGVDFRRYAFDFSGGQAANNGPRLPSGAGSDHYLRMTLAFVFFLPGAAK